MKSLSVKLGVIFLFIGLTTFAYAKAWGGDWRLFSCDDEDAGYYDAEDITRPSENIVRVWIKRKYKDKGVLDMVKNLGGKYENLDRTLSVQEIDCSSKKTRILSLSHYSKEGKIIFSGSRERQWGYIVQGSVGEVLYEAVCNKMEKGGEPD